MRGVRVGAHAPESYTAVKTAGPDRPAVFFFSRMPRQAPHGGAEDEQPRWHQGIARRGKLPGVELARRKVVGKFRLTVKPATHQFPCPIPPQAPNGCASLPRFCQHKAIGRRRNSRTVVFQTPESCRRTPPDASVPLFGFLKGKILRTQSVRPDFHPLRVSLPTFCTSRK